MALPRYLLKLGDSREVVASMRPECVDALVCDPPSGIHFMGKGWDHDHGGRDAWCGVHRSIFEACRRAMKPGAHGLVWALPRTSHWTATALEDAGFEIRDVVIHLFGSGFPKSLDVSKALDAAAGAVRLPTGRMRTRHAGGDAARSDHIHQLDPTVSEWPETAPATPEAIRFEGWGTALKPAAEHWILVRKPLVGTVAQNVLRYGTGGINVDGCRIEAVGRPLRVPHSDPCVNVYGGGFHGSHAAGMTDQGRWPANVTLDDEAAALLDVQSGQLSSPAAYVRSTAVQGEWLHRKEAGTEQAGFGDTGGASRFFYVAKPGKAERNGGIDPTAFPRGNDHPTVKAVRLMRWLCRLVTPPRGVILDPFLGSGSTGVAALAEGFHFIGIEREPQYLALAEQRIAFAIREHAPKLQAPERDGSCS